MTLPSSKRFQICKSKANVNMSSLFRNIAFVGALISLSGCAIDKESLTFTASPEDYRTKHPIIVSEQDKVLDLPVGMYTSKLTYGTSQVISGFVQNYKHSSATQLMILYPKGSANSGVAQRYAKNVAEMLQNDGVSAGELAMATYDAKDYGQQAPIRLIYSAISASTGPCGQWPEDLVLDSSLNINYHNFGCASQNNLAAQIANPVDLIAPRAVAPIDATRRANAIGGYQDNGADG